MGSISSFFFLGGGASPPSTHSPSSPSDLGGDWWNGLLRPLRSRGGEDDRLRRWARESGGTRCLLRFIGGEFDNILLLCLEGDFDILRCLLRLLGGEGDCEWRLSLLRLTRGGEGDCDGDRCCPKSS